MAPQVVFIGDKWCQTLICSGLLRYLIVFKPCKHLWSEHSEYVKTSNFLKVFLKDSLLKHALNGRSTSRKESVCASHERNHAPSPSQWLTSGKITTYKIGAISCLLGIVASFPILTHLHTHARTLNTNT